MAKVMYSAEIKIGGGQPFCQYFEPDEWTYLQANLSVSNVEILGSVEIADINLPHTDACGELVSSFYEKDFNNDFNM